MTDVLEAIGADLHRANARRVHRRARRRVVALVVVPAVLLAAGGTMAAVSDFDPLAGQWLPGPSTPAPVTTRPGSTVRDLRASAEAEVANVTVSSIIYRSADGGLCSIARRSDLAQKAPSVGCAAGFTLGAGFDQEGPASYSVESDRIAGQTWTVAFGFVRDGTGPATVSIDGHTVRATLGGNTVTVPVEVPSKGLTAQGRKLAARLPSRLELRPFVAVLPGVEVPAQASLTLKDASGRRWRITQRLAAPMGH